MTKIHTFLGFNNQKLVTIILSVEDTEEDAIDCDYFTEVEEEVHARKNLEMFLEKHKEGGD